MNTDFRRTGAICGVAAVAAVSLVVWQGSNAAFTATTENAGSDWSAGTVSLTDDDAESAMFTVGGLAPGSTGSRCIKVTYDGSLPTSAVRLYASTSGTDAKTDGAVLDDHLTLTVEYDTTTTGTFNGCGDFSAEGTVYSGTLAGLGSTATDFTSGVRLSSGGADWSPTTGQSRVLKFTYTVSASTPNTAQGDSAAATFTWEAQNR